MTIEALAMKVAEYFKKVMKEEGFETFTEMKECYWWTTQDIRAEVDAVITEVANELGVADMYLYDDGSVVQVDTYHDISYRKFSAMFRAYIKK